ncbi:MAG: sugar ABC transporter permease [Clostridia bacterium]|nr:sugar ABC transporter permease [Clostridia bacterium]
MQTKRAGMRWFTPYLYVLPCVLLLGIFVYIPVVSNFYYSTLNFSAFSPTKTFVGLENYKTLLTDPVVRTALMNNIWYCIISVVCQVGLSLCIAAVLEDKLLRRVSTVLRTVYFMPTLISVTVIALLFSFVYHPKIGLINQGLKAIGLKSLTHAWTGSTDSAIFSVIAMSQWHAMGYTMMLFIVAIQGIPQDLYEAAEIDGAGRLRRFIHVTLPQVRETAFVTMVTTVTGAFLAFNDVYILTGGGPGDSSTTLAVYMYKNGFALDKMGYASVIAVVMFVICMLLALVQKVIFRTGKGD